MAKSKTRKPHGSTGGASSGGGGGIFTSMRGGLKGLVGTGDPKKKKETTFWDVLFWLAALLLGAAVVYRWFR
jgi:hypothetical protein